MNVDVTGKDTQCSRERGKFSTALQKIKEYSEVIKILFAVLAALYALVQYQFSVTDKKIERALSYSEKYNQGELNTAKTNLQNFWLKPENLERLRKFRSIVEKTVKDYEDFRGTVKRLVKENDLTKDIVSSQFFFVDVTVCVENSLCDEDTTCQLFAREMKSFDSLYRDFLKEWEKEWQTGARKSVEEFVKLCGDPPLK